MYLCVCAFVCAFFVFGYGMYHNDCSLNIANCYNRSLSFGVQLLFVRLLLVVFSSLPVVDIPVFLSVLSLCMYVCQFSRVS